MKKSGTPSVNPSAKPAHPLDRTERTALDWARNEGEADRLIDELTDYLRRRRRRRARLGAVGATALVLLTAIFLPAWRAERELSSSRTAATVVVLRPEMRTLSDGSVVELQADTEIEVDFAGALRRVTLRKGEAHFQVAKDAQRPFVVAAGGVEVRAVGTAFSVELGAKEIEVLVTEGRVAVEKAVPPTATLPDSLASAGEQQATFGVGNRIVVEYTPEISMAAPVPRVTSLSPAEIDEHLAWRVPRLEFSGTPLSQVLLMFNQYGRVRLMLADPALGRLQLSGVLRADNIESLLHLLEGEFGLTSENRDGEVVLRRR
jgi:transmembrane sensor